MEDWVPSYLWNDPNFVNWWNSAPDSERMAFVREQNKQSAIAPVSLPTQQQSEIMARPNYQYTEYKDYSSEVDGDEELPQRSGGDSRNKRQKQSERPFPSVHTADASFPDLRSRQRIPIDFQKRLRNNSLLINLFSTRDS